MGVLSQKTKNRGFSEFPGSQLLNSHKIWTNGHNDPDFFLIEGDTKYDMLKKVWGKLIIGSYLMGVSSQKTTKNPRGFSNFLVLQHINFKQP